MMEDMLLPIVMTFPLTSRGYWKGVNSYLLLDIRTIGKKEHSSNNDLLKQRTMKQISLVN